MHVTNLLRKYPAAPAVAATVALFTLSSIPGDIPSGSATARVVYFVPSALRDRLHLLVYAVLGFLWRAAFVARTGHTTLGAWIGVALVGIADESWQSLIPERYPSFTDLLLDWAGASLGVAIHRYRQSLTPVFSRRQIRQPTPNR